MYRLPLLAVFTKTEDKKTYFIRGKALTYLHILPGENDILFHAVKMIVFKLDFRFINIIIDLVIFH